MFEGGNRSQENKRGSPSSFPNGKKNNTSNNGGGKRKKRKNSPGGTNINSNPNIKINTQHSVSATTSKERTPLPPNSQGKKPNNKKAARRKREKLLKISRKDSNGTPLSTSSESSTTRVLLDSMDLTTVNTFDAGESDEFERECSTAANGYTDLPTDTLILNTETVDRIIEQISTDIESEVEDHSGTESEEDEDEFGSGAGGGVQRYFLEKSGPKCFNCGESGHILKDCPESSTVPCNLCGQVGHSRFNCPQEVCYNCSRPGHQSKACPARRKRRVYDDDVCNRCGQPGHLSKECSMAWRGYVFARDLPQSHSKFLDELRGLRKRCYNCASISHFGDDCPSRRRPTYSIFHIPDFDYLDRVILRIKSHSKTNYAHSDTHANTHSDTHANTRSNMHANAHKNSHKTPQKSHPAESREQNAKEKQADNFKKIINSTKKPASTTQKSFDNQVNRTIFMESRGVSNANTNKEMEMEVDQEANLSTETRQQQQQQKKPVSFVHYHANQVRVNEFESGEGEENFRKGSSALKKNNNKPSYRGGYKSS